MKYVASFQASNSTTGTIFGTDSCDMHVYQGEKNPVTEINIGTSTLNTIGVSSGFDINYELTVKEKGVVSKASNITLSNPYSGDLPTTEMYLLAKNTADVATNFSACIVKGFKVYEGETLLMDLVPARRVLDGAIGFVDITTNIFYENLGADPLIAGNVVSPAETPTDTNGSWLFIYNGKWNENGKSGWTPACALGGSGGGSMPDRYVAAINGFTGEVFLGAHEIGTYTSDEIDNKILVINESIDAQADAIADKQDKLVAGDNITIVNNVISATGGSINAGVVVAFAGTTPPAGWLKCDGSAISRTLYSDLFTAIGTKYGSGDGVTTFNLPTLETREIVQIQKASESNGWIWYRLYSDGWVEQGRSATSPGGTNVQVQFQVNMADVNYDINLSQYNTDPTGVYNQLQFHSKTTNSMVVISTYGQSKTDRPFAWSVRGYSYLAPSYKQTIKCIKY
jgi:hypothetical protein